MIKLIACDMDGTLLNEEGKLSEEFFNVFERLVRRNIKFAVASGRQYFQLRKSFERIKDEIIYIAENGTIVKYKGEELYIDALSPQDVKDIVKFGLGLEDIYMVACGKKCAYINSKSEEIMNEVNKYYFKYKVVENFDEIEDDILKIAVLDIKGAENNSYQKFYKEFRKKLQVIVSGKIWLDIYNFNTNKGLAIKLLQDKFNIKKEETMTFGDYYNDIEMLQMAHYSYAMDNAPEGVKKHAKFIARSNKEDGVIRAIKEIILE